MAAPQGLVHFAGVGSVVSATYTLSAGTTPGTVIIEMKPQANFIARGGDVAWTFGGAEIFRLKDCRVDRNASRMGASGQVWTLAILDRRWRWAYGKISGHYNLRREDGSIDKDTQRNVQELATECLVAMGEKSYDVSALPTDAAPLVEWEAENPAAALTDLVSQFNCRVVLGLNDTVYVVTIGVGEELPIDSTVMENSLTINPSLRPDAVEVVCGKSRYQPDIKLEAVGRDVDGSWKPINELSYAPKTNGKADWKKEDTYGFQSISNDEDKTYKVKPRDLAKETVYRCYRITIKGSDGKELKIPGYSGKIKRTDQLLPIEDILVETTPEKDKNGNIIKDGKKLTRAAEVYGIFWNGSSSYDNVATTTRYKKDFTIDTAQGIVKFNERVLKKIRKNDVLPASYTNEPADLTLKCAVSIRDEKSRAWTRYIRGKIYDGELNNTGPRILQHDEIVLNTWFGPIVKKQDGGTAFTNQLQDNKKEVDKECDYYLTAADLEYQLKAPYSVKYAGLRAIPVDGAVQQVSWQVGPSGATTTASRNNEFSTVVPTYRERRLWEDLRNGNLRSASKVVKEQRATKDGKKG